MPKATIIIPAFNEAHVIKRLLEQLRPWLWLDDFQVIVACNGCTDSTARIARDFGVEVIELTQPGKTNALNEAYRIANGKVLVFLDADLTVSTEGIKDLIHSIEIGTCELAVPSMEVDTEHSSTLVRRFYQGWELNPYFDNGKVGGLYAILKSRLETILPYPDVINDDEWIRRKVPIELQKHVRSCTFIAHAPRTLKSLLNVRMRVYRGNQEMLSALPGKPEGPTLSVAGTMLRRAFATPNRIPGILVFSLLSVWLRVRYFFGAYSHDWGTDASSRAFLD